ncbi:MAG: UDP-N-acetylmuramate dehydrogenase [Carbonactinosporaceae bacterium]
MRVQTRTSLSTLTTLRLGGPAARLVEVTAAEDVVDAVTAADRAGEPVLVLGGGSNVVVSDGGFDGTVVLVRTTGVASVAEDDLVALTVQAGEPWDAVVGAVVAEGWAGIETLSGIPGLSGATPIQNVGAYGQEVSSTVSCVRVLDRRTGQVATMPAHACAFTYRSSAFKGIDRFVVLDVTYVLEVSGLSRPIRYPELAGALGVDVGDRVPLADVREAVLHLRRAKGMVIDEADPDSVSAGSFFTNPILDPAEVAALERRVAARLGDGVRPPLFPESGGRMKTSAAWLIDRAGFPRGYGHGAARISSKHTLALTNRGGATAADLLVLAREVRDGVREAFGVELVNEPVLVGVHL